MPSQLDLDNLHSTKNNFTSIVLDIANAAGRAVMDIYNSVTSTEVQYKSDKSPLTVADLASHKIISEALQNHFPDIPIVSEEGSADFNSEAVLGDRFWLVDPIDGTKEFIAHNGQFTICIGLIDKGQPVFGVVYAPALGLTYYGGPTMGSYKIDENGKLHKLHVSAKPTNVIYGSRSHPSADTAKYIEQHFPNDKVEEVGSQLKFVFVADGKADAYPRFTHTMKLWDVAAGQAVLEGAGGSITRPDGSDINYSATNLLAGDFLASAK